MTLAGLEGINFRKESNLSKRLIVLFNKALADCDEAKDRFPEDISKAYTSFSKKFKTKYAKDLVKIIAEEVNLHLKRVTVSGSIKQKVCTAITAIDDSDELAYVNAHNYIGASSSYKDTSLDQQIENLVNVKKGTLNIKKNSPFSKVEYEMFFDLSLFFFAKELLLGGRRFSAEEITTAIEHEIGHPVSLCEHANDFVYKTGSLLDTIREAGNLDLVNNKEEVLELLDRTEVILKEQPNSFKMHEDAINLKTKLTDAINNVCKREFADNKGLTIVWRLITNVLRIAWTIYITYYSIVCVLLYVPIITLIFDTMVMVSDTKDMGKRSEETHSKRNRYHIERLADEFVSRHGMGQYLGTVLRDINELTSNDAMQRMIFTRSASNMGLVSKICVVVLRLIWSNFGFNWNIMNVYEDHIERIERLLQNNMAVFKSKELDPALRDHYLESNKNLRKTIKEMRGNKAKELGVKTFDLVMKLLKPGTYLEMLSTGRLHSDYEEAYKQIEDLMNNKMFEQSARLDKLLKDL